MEIKEAQELVDEWIKTKGVRYFNELTNFTILMEEVGELARVFARKYGEQSSKSSDLEHQLEDEFGDVFWILLALANQTNINLQSALEKSLSKKTKRDSERHRNNPKLKN